MGRFSGDLDTKSIAGHGNILGKKNPHRSGAKRGQPLGVSEGQEPPCRLPGQLRTRVTGRQAFLVTGSLTPGGGGAVRHGDTLGGEAQDEGDEGIAFHM